MVNQNLAKKLKFWSKINVFVENQTLAQKMKFWSQIKFFVENQNLAQKLKKMAKIFRQVKICIAIMVVNRNLRYLFE